MNNNKSYKTAISRKTLSLPMKYLVSKSLIEGYCLDYGCGRGSDANLLNIDKYDPHYFPELPKKEYDTIICNYVLNVLLPYEIQKTIDNIKELLKDGGTAYLAVRRDIKKEGYTKKGTFQHNVELHLPILKEKKGAYCIYVLKK